MLNEPLTSIKLRHSRKSYFHYLVGVKLTKKILYKSKNFVCFKRLPDTKFFACKMVDSFPPFHIWLKMRPKLNMHATALKVKNSPGKGSSHAASKYIFFRAAELIPIYKTKSKDIGEFLPSHCFNFSYKHLKSL